jgi:hypothetical protein
VKVDAKKAAIKNAGSDDRSDNERMNRARSLALVLIFLAIAPVFAQANMAGEWTVSFQMPNGPMEFTMYVTQEGPRLSGRFGNENGEFPLRGTMDGNNFTITWSFVTTPITVTGTVEGESLSGTAKIGTSGSGPVSGTRIGP